MPESQPLDWDPEVEAPATVLVLGDDLVAVEAALYARFLGYSVLLICEGRVGDQLSREAGPFRLDQDTSSLGLAALQAQETELTTEVGALTPQEFVGQYLVPLAKTDLLYDSVQINSRVVSISRVGCISQSALTNEQRASLDFRVLIDSRKRGEFSQLIDVVLDCSGFRRELGLASGGGVAIGERDFRAQLCQAEEAKTAGNLVLYGKTALALATARKALGKAARITWIMPKRYGVLEDQQEQEAFERQVEAVQATADGRLAILHAWGIESLSPTENGWSIRVQVQDEETVDVECDEFFPADSAEGDWSFAEQIPLARQVECTATGRTAEPHFYVLGPKSGLQSASTEASAVYRAQIQACFAEIGGREGLNLYDTVHPQG